MSKTFEQFELTAETLSALEAMGFEAATPVQEKTIEPFMTGVDLIVQAPTGTGKTCAFGIPVVEKVNTRTGDLQTLILSPTRELAIQTWRALEKLAQYKKKCRITAIYGGEKIQKQFAAMRRNPQIIVATPGRLMDLMNQGIVKLNKIDTVVLDEADRMLDMGFRKDIQKILAQVPSKRQTVMFSATMSADIIKISKSFQKDAQNIEIKQETLTVDSVKQYYLKVKNGAKKTQLLTLLEQNEVALSLIFVNTKRMADRLSQDLKKSGYRSAAMHGDLSQRERERIMHSYRSGKLDLLVTTDVCARGIDVQNIDTIINYDIPNDTESYVHRIGRTGRASAQGTAFTLLYGNEMKKLGCVVRETKAEILPLDLLAKIG